MFRQVYPFTPALVQTLIAVSSVLQRERTALKLMLQLLVDRRDELMLGELIPVGDLYDVIAEGDEPFSDATRFYFENAKKLFNQKFVPLLERKHGAIWQDVIAGRADPDAARNMRNDARLLKTLLLAALVPEVEALKGLTGQRLAALNHGTLKAPLAGTEGRLALAKCREWVAEVGEIKITDDINPVISIQITGVDVDPIIAAARAQDNAGNRRRAVREMLFENLGIQETNDFFTTYALAWRAGAARWRSFTTIYVKCRMTGCVGAAARPGRWQSTFHSMIRHIHQMTTARGYNGLTESPTHSRGFHHSSAIGHRTISAAW
jgi:hypothetical protein